MSNYVVTCIERKTVFTLDDKKAVDKFCDIEGYIVANVTITDTDAESDISYYLYMMNEKDKTYDKKEAIRQFQQYLIRLSIEDNVYIISCENVLAYESIFHILMSPDTFTKIRNNQLKEKLKNG